MKRPAVFFDRDNTLIVCDSYLGDPDAVTLAPGAARAVARARELNYAVVIFSNQSGVARGMFTEEDVHRVNARLDELLRDNHVGAIIDRHEFCPHHPDATVARYRQASEFRKPAPGMIYQAARQLDLDLSRSWVVGDAARDIEAGQSAGCRTILVRNPTLAPSPAAREAQAADPDFTVGSLGEAIEAIERNPFPPPVEAPPAPIDASVDSESAHEAQDSTEIDAPLELDREAPATRAEPSADDLSAAPVDSSPAEMGAVGEVDPLPVPQPSAEAEPAGAAADAEASAPVAAEASRIGEMESSPSAARADIEPPPPAVAAAVAPVVVVETPPPVSVAASVEIEALATTEPEPAAASEVESPAASEVESPVTSEVQSQVASEVDSPAASELEAPVPAPVPSAVEGSVPSAVPAPVPSAVEEHPAEPIGSEAPPGETPAEETEASMADVNDPDDDAGARRRGIPAVILAAKAARDATLQSAPNASPEQLRDAARQAARELTGGAPRDSATADPAAPASPFEPAGAALASLPVLGIEPPPPPAVTSAPAASSAPAAGRLELLAEQILVELRRRHEDAADFSVSKLMAGITMVMSLAALVYAYFSRDNAAVLQNCLLLGILLQAFTISLLVMGRQK